NVAKPEARGERLAGEAVRDIEVDDGPVDVLDDAAVPKERVPFLVRASAEIVRDEQLPIGAGCGLDRAPQALDALLGHRFLDGEKIEAGPLDDLAERRVVLVLAVAEMADIPRRERRRGGGQRDDEKQRDRVEAGTYPGGAARREADGSQRRTKRDRQRTAAGFGSQVLDLG